jgi:hypothetical protein
MQPKARKLKMIMELILTTNRGKIVREFQKGKPVLARIKA